MSDEPNARLRAAVDVDRLAQIIGDAQVAHRGNPQARDAVNARWLANFIVRALAAAPTPTEDEPRHEVECPECGATIRARMADTQPKEER